MQNGGNIAATSHGYTALMQHPIRKPTRMSEEIANSEALARLVELGLINVDVIPNDPTAPPQTMYRLSDRFTIPSQSR